MKKTITIVFIIILFITLIQIINTYALYKSELSGEYQQMLGVWSVKVNETDLSSGNANMTFEVDLRFDESEYINGNLIAPGSNGYFDILIDPTDTDVSIKYEIQLPTNAQIKIGEDILEWSEGMPIEIISIDEDFVKVEGTEEVIDEDTDHINIIDATTNTITGLIPLSVIENGYKDRIRVNLIWSDNSTGYIGSNYGQNFIERDKVDTMLGNAKLGNTLGFTTGTNTVDSALINTTESTLVSGNSELSVVIPVNLNLIQYMGEEIIPVTP